MEIDSKPEEMDRLERRLIQLKIEREALKKEKDEASKKRLQALENRSTSSSASTPTSRRSGRPRRRRCRAPRRSRRRSSARGSSSRRRAARAISRACPSSSTAGFPSSRSSCKAAQEAESQGADAAAQQGHRRGDRRGRLELDRHPGLEDARGRAREAAAMEEALGTARRRPGRGGEGRVRCDPPLARGTVRSEPAERLVPVPRADRRRQDRALQGARRVPVRHRRGDGAHRHVRVHGEALRGAPDRRAAGLRRLRRGRLPHRSGASPSVLA